MTKLMRWINRSMFHVVADPSARQSVDHVDGARLAATDFWASASMRFDDTPLDHFRETLPAFSLASTPPRLHGMPDRRA